MKDQTYEIEPFSYLMFVVFAWIGVTIGTVIIIAVVVTAVASAIFHAPARLLRKGGA